MNLFKAVVFALASSTVLGQSQSSRVAVEEELLPNTMEPVDATVRTDASLGTERQVRLHLDRMHVSVAFLAVESDPATDETTMLEFFKVAVDSLTQGQLELLKAGRSLNASVTPIADFRIRDEISGDVIAATAEKTARALGTLETPTLCGDAVARGLMSLSFDGKDKSILSKTSYFRSEQSNNHQRKLQSTDKIHRRLDICESIDGIIGGCTREAACTIQRTRRKRVQRTVCLGVDKCGRRVSGTVTVESDTEFDERDFAGSCETIVLPLAPDDCECFVTPAGAQQLQNWHNEPLPPAQCSNNNCTGHGTGDPHFKTFDGTHYSYMGACDMVMTKSPSFGLGLGLDMHIRTTIKDSYSFISNVAVKIGADVLEVEGDGSIYFNNRTVASLPASISGYRLSKADSPTSRIVYKVDLGLGEQIAIVAFKGMLKVRVDAVLPQARGLLGTTGTSGLVAPDGKTILTELEMGQAWQVQTGQHPFLFHASRAPQFPQPCALPTQSATRRLGENAALFRLAGEACAGVVDTNMKDACIFDVANTGDMELAWEYTMHDHEEDLE